MNLKQLPKELDFQNIVFHSKNVSQGDLFVAIPGTDSDGHDYIEEAVHAGACAIIGQHQLDINLPIPYVRVDNARLALALLAAEHYQHPYLQHNMIGVTGTNGKTTTAYMIQHILTQAKQSCSLFGTVERVINGQAQPSIRTTEDAVTMQQWLKESDDDHVVMEVSSHGLAQSRVDGMRFDYAVFTNLSHEHLDYHQSFDQYFQAKAHLFHLLHADGKAIINGSCSWGKRLHEQLLLQGTKTLTYGFEQDHTLQLIGYEQALKPRFWVREQDDIISLQISIPGLHNIMNAMAAVLIARQLSITYPVIADALASFPGVKGRMEAYAHPSGAQVIIDYAHTPDGLEQCLRAVAAYRPYRLVHIFGFRGKRDEAKWAEMLELSCKACDQTILTTDDLNGTSCEQMKQRYETLCQGRSSTAVIADRTYAIQSAWERAEKGDCIVITGKGAEVYTESFALPVQSDTQTIQFLQTHFPSSHDALIHSSASR